jgi:V8-like Glu-specific endopeptidase
MKNRIHTFSVMAVALALMTGSTFAQNGPVSMTLQPAIEAQAQAIREYWTPERMRGATPMPFPAAPVTGAEVTTSAETELPPEAYPGFAPGWRPGRAPQPDSGSRIEITPDDPQYQLLFGGEQPQTSPPFSDPPSSPTDFGNYAPFNRFTWNAGNYLAYPISVIGKLFFTQGGLNFLCSASVIHKNTLATAGHCVHDGSNSPAGWSTNILFCPAFNQGGINPVLGCWAGLLVTTSFQWFTSGNSDRDYGCIVTHSTGTHVNNSVGNVTGWLGRSWNWPTRQSTFAWGYPAASPFPGNRIITVVSTEWYQLDRNTSEPQLSKFMGNDMTPGASGGPWWLNMVHSNVEYADIDGSLLTDPFQGHCCPTLNGVNSHRRCTQAGCFTQEIGSPQFLNTTSDGNESEDVFSVCFNNGGT